jgi:hypothetical protein
MTFDRARPAPRTAHLSARALHVFLLMFFCSPFYSMSFLLDSGQVPPDLELTRRLTYDLHEAVLAGRSAGADSIGIQPRSIPDRASERRQRAYWITLGLPMIAEGSIRQTFFVRPERFAVGRESNGPHWKKAFGADDFRDSRCRLARRLRGLSLDPDRVSSFHDAP